MISAVSPLIWTITVVVLVAIMVIDLAVIGRRQRTVTTKDRLNRCLPYPWRVASDARKGGWGLYENGERLTHFSDHMELRPNHAGILRPWRGGAA